MRVEIAANKRNTAKPDSQVIPADNPAFWTHSRANKPGPKAWLRERGTADVLEQWQYGLVPVAIAAALGLSLRTVAGYLRELERDGEITIPPYLRLS